MKTVDEFRSVLTTAIVGNWVTVVNKAAGNMFETIGNFLPMEKNLFDTLSIISKKSGKEIEKALFKLKLDEKLLVVIDDFERYEGDNFNELLGAIGTTLLEKNIHVLLVCCEKEILNSRNVDTNKHKFEKYLQRKEKTVRFTFSFTPNIPQSVMSVISALPENHAANMYSKIYCSEFNSMVRMLEKEKNLRVWQYSLDCFDTIINQCKIPLNRPYLDRIFRDILVTCSLNHANPTLTENRSFEFTLDHQEEWNSIINTIGKHLSDYFNLSYSQSYFENGREFLLRYPSQQYYMKDALRQFIRYGYLDSKQVLKNFDSLYPYATKYEKAYMDMEDFLKIDNLKESFKNLFEGLTKDVFDLDQLINIGIRADFLKIHGYLKLYGITNLMEEVNNAILRVSRDKISSSYIREPRRLVERIDSSSKEITKSLQTVLEKIKNYQKKDEAKDLESIIDQLENGQYADHYPTTVVNLVTYTVETQSYSRIANLSGIGIHILASYIDDMFRITNITDYKCPISTFYDGLTEFVVSQPKEKHDLDFLYLLGRIESLKTILIKEGADNSHQLSE